MPQNHQSDEMAFDYTMEAERARWEEWTNTPGTRFVEEPGTFPDRPGWLAGASFFLALLDDECHELIPESHVRWRTPFEHDVLLPKNAKEDGIAYTPSWDGESTLPNVTAVRLRAGQLMIRDGKNVHRGHSQRTGERLTLAGGWSRGPPAATTESDTESSSVVDVRGFWQLDPAVREALPSDWMKAAYDRWREKNHAGSSEEDVKAGWVIQTEAKIAVAAAAAEATPAS